jgi:ATP-dependent Lon protease
VSFFFGDQQLKAIQQELGESSELSEEIQQLRDKINEIENARKTCRRNASVN